MKNTYYLNLHDKPFSLIKERKKTVEIRLFDEKRQKLSVGDELIFKHVVTKETLKAIIKKMERFTNFKELYECVPHEFLGYSAQENVHFTDMYAYYKESDEQHFGVVAIYISVI